MKYIKFKGGTCFCGADFEYCQKFENISNKELDRLADDYAYENAESYESIERDYCIYKEEYDSKEEYEEAYNEAHEEYYSGAYCHWEEITKEEYEEACKNEN